MNVWRYSPSFFTPAENRPVRFHHVFFQCAGNDEQLGKLVYNALETATGNFVLLHEWVLRWQKKMGPFLTSQEKEKIDKCKKQVGIRGGPWAETPPRTWRDDRTKELCIWLASKDGPEWYEICLTRGDAEGPAPFPEFSQPLAAPFTTLTKHSQTLLSVPPFSAYLLALIAVPSWG